MSRLLRRLGLALGMGALTLGLIVWALAAPEGGPAPAPAPAACPVWQCPADYVWEG